MELTRCKEALSAARTRWQKEGPDSVRSFLWDEVFAPKRRAGACNVLDLGVYDGRTTAAYFKSGFFVKGIELKTYENVFDEIERRHPASEHNGNGGGQSLDQIRPLIAYGCDIRDLALGHSHFFLYDVVTAFLPTPTATALFVRKAPELLKTGGVLILTLDNPILARTTALLLEFEGWPSAQEDMPATSHPDTLQATGLQKPYTLTVAVKRESYLERQRELDASAQLTGQREALLFSIQTFYNAMQLEGSLRGKPVGARYLEIQKLVEGIFAMRRVLEAEPLDLASLEEHSLHLQAVMTRFQPLSSFTWYQPLLEVE